MRPKLNQLWALTSHSPSALSRRMACIFRLEQQRTSDTSRPTSPAPRPGQNPRRNPPTLLRAVVFSLYRLSAVTTKSLCPQPGRRLTAAAAAGWDAPGGQPPAKGCPPRPLPSSTTAVRYPPPSRVASPPRAPAPRVRAARRRPFLTDRVSFHRHPRGANPPRLVVGRVCPAALCGCSKCPRRGARSPVATEGRNASHTGEA